MLFKAHDYQKVAKDWILEHEKCGIFLDMGLGKTVTTLTAVDLLANDYLEVDKTLVIAPKRVAETTWPTEKDKWDHLEGLNVSKIIGTPKQREEALEVDADIYVITRDNIVWLVDYLGKDWDFDTLVIDELSSFKNPSSKRFKKLKTVTPYFKRVIGLTGTPAPNSYLDLWSQIYLLDRGERLGKNITAYRREFFDAFNRGMYTEYKLKPGAKERIDNLISDICISMKAKDCLKDFKDPIIVDRYTELNSSEMKKYREMANDAITEFENSEIVALSAATVTNKLLQMANGAVYDENKNVHKLHDRKLDALEELVEEAQGENILVFYSFVSDYERIMTKFPDAVKLEGPSEIEDWNSGKIKMLLAHPASAGHGLNLQDGGSLIVWFGLNWSLELYQQANARLHRQGQKDLVRIYRILAKDTVDEKVVQVLNGKHITQEELLRRLKHDIL